MRGLRPRAGRRLANFVRPKERQMSPKMFFRVLVGLSLSVAIAISVLAFWPVESSEEWRAVLEWHGNGGIVEYLSRNFPNGGWAQSVLFLILVVPFGFTVAVQIGMFLFWRFARTGYVLLAALFLVVTLFDGLVVMTPIEAALYNIALILDGAVITMAYLQPIASYFEASKA
jgi:hypothetical protein